MMKTPHTTLPDGLYEITSEDEGFLLKEGRLLPLMESFYSLQGEGAHTGKPAYFLRIGGCDVGCHWCDVKESWNPAVHPLTPVEKIIGEMMACECRSVVVTGGEPLMYNLDVLCREVKKKGITTFLETSGAYALSGEWDWICLSPKRKKPPLDAIYSMAHEIKVIIHDKEDLIWAEECRRKINKGSLLFLQPEWSKRQEMTPVIIDYILKNPVWRISLQTHKYLGIP
jgi:7-carboxy-7-deazaguanine synthase